MIEAGIHYGHRASRWNPKMKPYIFGKRNLIHIINIKETLRGLLLAKNFLTRVVGQGKDVVIVGTKRQARKCVQDRADEVNMHWVIDRWLGGTLTNFREIRKRVGRLEQLEELEAEGMLDAYSKKEGASLRREMRKIHRNLGGIRKMTRLPGAMIVVDQRREVIAVREAVKLKIPVICLLDTDSDPDLIDIPIPGNDDAMRGIDIIIRELCSAVREGVIGRTDKAEAAEPPHRRRSARPTMGRADPDMATAGAAEQGKPAPAPDDAAAPAAPAPAPQPTAAPAPPAPVAVTPADAPAPAPVQPDTRPEPQAEAAEAPDAATPVADEQPIIDTPVDPAQTAASQSQPGQAD